MRLNLEWKSCKYRNSSLEQLRKIHQLGSPAGIKPTHLRCNALTPEYGGIADEFPDMNFYT